MTIAKTGNKSQYAGDGVTLKFAFPYRFFADGTGDSINVYLVHWAAE
mgnify:CR=1 FL=1